MMNPTLSLLKKSRPFFFPLLLSAVFVLGAPAAQAEVRTVTDVRGREVKVNVPAERMVLGFYYPDYIAEAWSGLS